MKILITGGAGFIGSAVIRHIIQKTQDSVVNLDALTYAGNLESLAEVAEDPRYEFEKANICDKDALDTVLAKHQPDAIMHLAAESHVDRSIDGPAAFIETNVVGTYTLLEAARQYWQQLDDNRKQAFRFHHISTDEVYGDLPHPSDVNDECLMVNGELNENTNSQLNIQHSKLNTGSLPLFTEKTAYAPSSPYSATKASSDHLVRAWQRTYGLPTLITNCSNNYGPYQFPEKLIPLVMLNALEGKKLPIYGKGDQIRDWLYVDDHARALYKIISQGNVGETYNIGGHNEKTNLEVVQTICTILDELAPMSERGHPLNTQHSTLIIHVRDRPGHDRRYAIDADKIKHDLGWAPEETFETGIRKTIQWYLDNAKWCQRVQDGSYQRDRLGTA